MNIGSTLPDVFLLGSPTGFAGADDLGRRVCSFSRRDSEEPSRDGEHQLARGPHSLKQRRFKVVPSGRLVPTAPGHSFQLGGSHNRMHGGLATVRGQRPVLVLGSRELNSGHQLCPLLRLDDFIASGGPLAARQLVNPFDVEKAAEYAVSFVGGTKPFCQGGGHCSLAGSPP